MSELKLWEIIQQGISKSYEGYGLHCVRGEAVAVTDHHGRHIGCVACDDRKEAPISVLVDDGQGDYLLEVNDIYDWGTAEDILKDMLKIHSKYLHAPAPKAETETQQLLRELRQCRTRLGKLIEEMTK